MSIELGSAGSRVSTIPNSLNDMIVSQINTISVRLTLYFDLCQL